MKRFFDVILSVIFIVVSMPIVITIYFCIKVSSPGPVLYWSTRVGKNRIEFQMPKFRTMRLDTPEVASDLLVDPDYWLTPFGKYLRRTSLDELPQLISVLRGDMSLVGPRPALYNQVDLIMARKQKDIEWLMPGITGWAQVNGRDGISVPEKVRLDAVYAKRQSILFDCLILCFTCIAIIQKKGIAH